MIDFDNSSGTAETRIVSVTPVAVERDSRTFKFATSFARCGYESVVVEGETSASLADPVPFSLISSQGAPPQARAAAQGPPPATSRSYSRWPARILGLLRASQRWLAGKSAELLPFRFLRHYKEANQRTFEALPSASLYHLHSFWHFPAVSRKCRQTGAAYIYDAHDSYRDISRIPIFTVPTIFYLLERLAVRGSASCSTVSAGLAARLGERFKREFVVVRNCHDLRLDEPGEPRLRTRAGIPDDAFLLAIVGQLKPGLAVEEAIEAVSLLDDRVHLAFLGNGYEEQEARVPTDIKGRIHFVRPVEPTKVADFIAGVDLSPVLYKPVTENYVNALPNGFFHAIAAGIPLLYPGLREIRALAEEFDLGVPVDSGDARSIAAGVRTLLEDPHLLSRYRSNALKARETLNWESEERVIVEQVRSALPARVAASREDS